MDKIFSSDFFIQNRKSLQDSLGIDNPGVPLVVAAHGLLQRGADSTFPFHQDSNFRYLTGIDEPDLILVMDSGNEYCIVPGRTGSREAFDGAVDKKHLSEISGISEFVDEEEGWQRLGRRLKQTRKVYTLSAPAAYIEQYGLYTNPARSRLVERLTTWQPECEVLDIREHLIGMRMVKQPEELKAVQKAIDITIRGINKVSASLKKDGYEYEFEIENELAAAFRTKVASGHAFTPIVAGGKRACTLHNVQNNGKLQSGELIVIDVGAEVDHYAADITRTVALGQPSGRQRQVHEAVLDVQKQALSLLKPGTLLKEYEGQVEKIMGTKLQELGLIKEADHDSVRRYYPHATSHFLGLDVHDVGDYMRPLEPGMVLTCEPGIYIPEEGIGVRIEDDILITESGHIVLSEKLPRQLTA